LRSGRGLLRASCRRRLHRRRGIQGLALCDRWSRCARGGGRLAGGSPLPARLVVPGGLGRRWDSRAVRFARRCRRQLRHLWFGVSRLLNLGRRRALGRCRATCEQSHACHRQARSTEGGSVPPCACPAGRYCCPVFLGGVHFVALPEEGPCTIQTRHAQPNIIAYMVLRPSGSAGTAGGESMTIMGGFSGPVTGRPAGAACARRVAAGSPAPPSGRTMTYFMARVSSPAPGR